MATTTAPQTGAYVEPPLHRPRVDHHDRPQEDRRDVHRHVLRLLHAGRAAGPGHPQRAGRAGPPVHRRGDLQPALRHARRDDDLPLRHAHDHGPGELHRAAPAGRGGHGLPAHQRAVLLDARGRRHPHRERLRLRRRAHRLDALRAALHDRAGAGRGPAAARSRGARLQLHLRCHQLHRHHLQDARAGHGPAAHADVLLDDAGDGRPAALLAARS